MNKITKQEIFKNKDNLELSEEIRNKIIRYEEVCILINELSKEKRQLYNKIYLKLWTRKNPEEYKKRRAERYQKSLLDNK